MAKLTIEMADTPAELAHGLMHRKDLPADAGMLFKFPSVTEAHFWGKNTYIPLDIAFVDRDNRITEIKQITPMSTRMIHSSGLCSMAIEANAGFFEENGVGPGHKIAINGDTVEFKEC
jgi:uncharacterized membrane protein (UPF0127 family)